ISPGGGARARVPPRPGSWFRLSGWCLAPDHAAAPVAREREGAAVAPRPADRRHLGRRQRLAGFDRVLHRGLAPPALPLLGLVELVVEPATLEQLLLRSLLHQPSPVE